MRDPPDHNLDPPPDPPECGDCDGEGERPCSACAGRGEVPAGLLLAEDCDACGGTGAMTCRCCKGAGTAERYRGRSEP